MFIILVSFNQGSFIMEPTNSLFIPEVFVEVTKKFNYEEITKCREVCKSFKELADDARFYKGNDYPIKTTFEAYVAALFAYEKAMEESKPQKVLEQLRNERDGNLELFSKLSPGKGSHETQMLLNREKVINLFGGREAFTKLPKVPMPAQGLYYFDPNTLTTPFSRGKLRKGGYFIVIRLKDKKSGTFSLDKIHEITMFGICTMGTAGYEPKLLPYHKDCEYQIAGGITPGAVERADERYKFLAEILKKGGNDQFSIE